MYSVISMRAAEKLNELEDEDLRVLMGIEQGMRRFRTVPANQVAFFARYNKEETQYRLDKIHKLGLIIRHIGANRGDPNSYVLNFDGYDILALHTFFAQGILASVGLPLGRGKESDVYRCLTPQGEEVALKLHRLGQTSFRNVRKLRDYVNDRGHINWLYMSRLSASREYEALKKIQDLKLNVKVPKVLGHNRHAIVMGIHQGDELYRFDTLPNPIEIFSEIITEYKEIYLKAHIIHADLGEFNVLLDTNYNILIIDWPQSVDWDHPNGMELLRRDITNICEFFRKKYGIGGNVDEIIGDILEKRKELQTRNPDESQKGNYN